MLQFLFADKSELRCVSASTDLTTLVDSGLPQSIRPKDDSSAADAQICALLKQPGVVLAAWQVLACTGRRIVNIFRPPPVSSFVYCLVDTQKTSQRQWTTIIEQ